MRKIGSLLLLALLLASCGDDGAAGEPLVYSTLMGSYAGVSFTPINGFATIHNGSPLIVVGAGPVHCGSESGSSPPRGYNASIHPPDFAVGSYGSVFVQMFKTAGGFEGVGANQGTVNITAVTPDTISGDVTFAYTDADSREFELTGEFEVVRCAP